MVPGLLGCEVEVAVLSDPGRVRKDNEDAVYADAGKGVALVADGMGGHRGGYVASRLARQVILEALGDPAKRTEQTIQRALDAANAAIIEAAKQDPANRDMGTTLAMACFDKDYVVLAHVGDSRIYRLRAGKLGLLTRDDSLLSEQVSQGLVSAAGSAASHNRHLITAALGLQQPLTVHFREEGLEAGDIFLICSDGLHDMVGDQDIELILRSLHMNLPLAARHLVQLANDLGGFDNVSVVLAKAVPASAPRGGGWLGRLLHWRSRGD